MKVRASYDVIVVGSGIAGAIIALLLARRDIRTLVVERKSHPRFAIGESTVPTTTALLTYLSMEYDVPELAQIGHYLGLRENGCVGWPKQSFWYGVHEEGRELRADRELMLEAILLPNGPEVHMLRADVDAFLVSRLPSYGVDYVDHTELADFTKVGRDVEVRLDGPGRSDTVRCRLVVDASGHASYFARRFGLRDEPARLRTNTRSLFGHFRGLADLDSLGESNPVFRFKRGSGTMHHCFDGGWAWVIPFDNGTTSIGLQLDRDRHPLDPSIPPEEELRQVARRYPTMGRHFDALESVTRLVRTDRVQFTSRTILGDGFILSPHAAAFIEPLFSTGIVLTLAFCSRFARAAVAAHRDDDWDTERFRPIDEAFQREIRQIDHLVHGCFRSFHDYDVFKQYWRAWVVATVAQYSAVVLSRGAPWGSFLYGAGLPGFAEALGRLHADVASPRHDSASVAARLHSALEPWWERVCRPAFFTRGEWSVGSSQGCCVIGASTREMADTWLGKLLEQYRGLGGDPSPDNASRYFDDTAARLAHQRERYAASPADGSDYHDAYERILANALPSFDYRGLLGL